MTTNHPPVTVQMSEVEAHRFVVRVLVAGDYAGHLIFASADTQSTFLSAVTGSQQAARVERVDRLFTPWNATVCEAFAPP